MATTLRSDTPTGRLELEALNKLKVGDTRRGLLFPALDIGVEWVCTAVSKIAWEFDGQFFGQPLYQVTVTLHEGTLTLETRKP